MDTTEFMQASQPPIQDVSIYAFQGIRGRAICADGFSVSIQASRTHYCSPRENSQSYYSEVELGYPSVADDLIQEYAETPDEPTGTVYGYVPIAVVDSLIAKHGGIVSEEKLEVKQ